VGEEDIAEAHRPAVGDVTDEDLDEAQDRRGRDPEGGRAIADAGERAEDIPPDAPGRRDRR
jgi:hypothetical protein